MTTFSPSERLPWKTNTSGLCRNQSYLGQEDCWADMKMLLQVMCYPTARQITANHILRHLIWQSMQLKIGLTSLTTRPTGSLRSYWCTQFMGKTFLLLSVISMAKNLTTPSYSFTWDPASHHSQSTKSKTYTSWYWKVHCQHISYWALFNKLSSYPLEAYSHSSFYECC